MTELANRVTNSTFIWKTSNRSQICMIAKQFYQIWSNRGYSDQVSQIIEWKSLPVWMLSLSSIPNGKTEILKNNKERNKNKVEIKTPMLFPT